MIINEYTPAMILIATGEITKEFDRFNGMNTAVVALVVMYLIIKMILDHSSKSVKNRGIENLVKSQTETNENLKATSEELKELSGNLRILNERLGKKQ